MKVTLNGEVLADSDKTVVVEGNHYFPPELVSTSLFTDSNTKTVCGWKGTASYYNAVIGDKTVNDVAWYYPETSARGKSVEGYVAFYKTKVQFEL